ncbi:MAG: glutaredoxin 3 [Pseudomonadota bacterium]|nr:glutaredoxin 3 [Pseudomonadota bacterium]
MAKVEIYTTMLCGFCYAAKRLLNNKGVAYTEIDTMLKPGVRREMIERAQGKSTVPQIFIDDVHVGGCDELYLLEQNKRLDPLLEGKP